MNEISIKVSIVLPTYNGVKCIRQSIDSCLNQSYKNIELIIVDDGSTNEIPDIIKSYKDERIKYFRHKKYKGLPHVLNTGFAKATGKYLTWTSDDHQYLPNAIEEMVNCLKKNDKIDFVYADYWAYYPETDNKELRRLPDKLNFKKENGVGACFLYTRRVYQNVGDYNPRYELVEDYDYWIRICKRFNYLHYPHPLYIYFEHSQSLKSTRYHRILLFDNVLKYQNRYISLFELGRSIFLFCSNTIRYQKGKKEAIIIYIQNIVKISRISLSLGILSILSLIYFLMFKIVKYSKISSSFIFHKYEGDKKIKEIIDNIRTINGKINILFIVPSMVVGGAEKVNLDILTYIDKDKFELHFITTDKSENIWTDLFKNYTENIYHLPELFHSSITYKKYILKYIEKSTIEVILISNSLYGYKIIPDIKKTFPDIRIIDLNHGESNITKGSYLYPYISDYDRYFLKRIVISEQLKNYFVDNYSICPNKISIIRNGIDNKIFDKTKYAYNVFKKKFTLKDSDFVISYIGRLSREKHPEYIIEIANKIINNDNKDNFKFFIAGDGYLYEKLINKIVDYHLTNSVFILGKIYNVQELLNDTNVLLVLSETEGIPLTILEAMSMGVPVISTNVGAIPEIIEDGVNGFLIESNDNQMCFNFIDKIYFLKDNPEIGLLFEYSSKEKIASEYSIERMIKSYEKEFIRL